ncbi:hypothetical protein PR048_004925 [Dryococelus australis]|uniref:Uncharacterized protein n=1 Tax=Dryococelus australis TaxID=614101 RepID=A0ABQ9I7W7_9NEOP|nr:hypothetical protein PR048_004925 [Dryococelus australis]
MNTTLDLTHLPLMFAHFVSEETIKHTQVLHKRNGLQVQLNNHKLKANSFYINEYTKGSCQIASCIYYHICNTDLKDIRSIKLMAEGCGGQNNNSTMVGILCSWLAQKSPISILKIIVLLFSVVCYSNIFPDQVFGRFYEEIISQLGTVLKMETDVRISTWKSVVKDIEKPPSSYQFQF